jgi:predicted  nucleic acid-binding Zn-ribbon protein
MGTIDDPELLTHHAGWALTARYTQHVSSALQVVTATGAYLRLHLEECAGQVKAKNHAIKDIQKGNQELLQKNACLEMRIRELNDELMRTYRSQDFKTDDLDDTHTRLQHAQDELTATQSYINHLETELHERRAGVGESGSDRRLAAQGGAHARVDPSGARGA